MSDKKLLEEQTIRRFMKLAKIEGLADEFVETNSGVIKEGKTGKHTAEVKPEETVEEGGGYGGDVEEMGSDPEMPMQEEELGDMSDDMGGGEGNEELFKKVVQAVAEAMGVDASVEGDEGMDDEEGEEMDDMGDEEGEEEEEELDESEELNEEEEKCEKCGGTDCKGDCDEKEKKTNEGLAEAVLARVKARLIAEAKAAKMKAMKKGMKGKGKIAAKKAAKKGTAAAAGAKMEEAAKASKGSPKGHGASKKPFGTSKGVANVAKGSAKTGNMTPAKASSKHTK